jgi:cation:H+ antiporter
MPDINVPPIVITLILSVLGFAILIKFADFFVDGAASLARNFKISTTVVGLTIVAFGTSAPELAISFNSHLAGNADMMLGNVIGSNIANILVIFGLAVIIKPFNVSKDVAKKEIPILMLITLGVAVVLSDNLLDLTKENALSRNDGVMLMLLFSVFVYYLITIILKKENETTSKPKYKLFMSIVMTLLGLVGIIFGSSLVVDNVSEFATIIGISQKIIAVTVVSIGTSLPELVTTIVAARKGESGMAIGNIIGSNIFNTCIVLGLPIALLGEVTTQTFNIIDVIFMLLAVVLLWVFVGGRGEIKRYEGVLFLATYCAYIAYIFIQ